MKGNLLGISILIFERRIIPMMSDDDNRVQGQRVKLQSVEERGGSAAQGQQLLEEHNCIFIINILLINNVKHSR